MIDYKDEILSFYYEKRQNFDWVIFFEDECRETQQNAV